MARHKRMQLEHPGTRKRRPPPIPADRIFLTRRVLLAKTAVVAGFGALATKLGWMQIVDQAKFSEAAQGNIQETIFPKANRGLIYDRHDRPLAKNETAFQVRIVPADLPPRDTPERRRVLDTLIAELRCSECLVLDPDEIPWADRDEVYAEIARARGRNDAQLPGSIDAMRAAALINYVVLLNDDLDIDEAAMFRDKARKTPGLRVMNYIDYLLANAPSARSRLIVKTDVPRETALRIEANKLHLPGVEVDDSVLVRRYPAGPIMSHLLGFVGPISQDELEENVTVGGYEIYELNDQIGKDGLEFSWEETLRGSKGVRRIYKDPSGTELGAVEDSEVRNIDPKPGKSLRLTIDLELQSAATRALKDYCRYSREDREAKRNDKNKIWPGSGAVVAMDPRNGEVLAMVSYPQYDNEMLADGISEALWEELTDDEGDRPYFNRAIDSAQPPGSTLKCFLAAAGLHDGTLVPETTYTCTGAIFVPLAYDIADGNKHVCWFSRGYGQGHGTIDLVSALKTSCDVYFYNVGTPNQQNLWFHDADKESGDRVSDRKEFEGLGIEPIYKELTEHFWFGQALELDLPGGSAGVVPNDAWKVENIADGGNWSAGDTIITSIGQGYFLATPLQLAVNTAALANGGKIFKPMLAKDMIDPADDAVRGTPEAGSFGTVTPTDPKVLRDMAYKQEHIDVIRNAMREVVHGFDGLDEITNGSASYLQLDADYSYANPWPRTNPDGMSEEDMIYIAGKTGTAEVGQITAEGTYDNQHAWFTCFAPYDNPEIAVSVLVEYGGEGAHYAAPVADVVLRAYFETTGRRSRNEVNDDGKRVSVLREDKEPVLDVETAEPLNWFEPGVTLNTTID